MAIRKVAHGAAIIAIPVSVRALGASAVEAAQVKVPCKGKILGFHARTLGAGGGTPFTDVDVMLTKGATGPVDCLTADVVCRDSSADTEAGAFGSLSATESVLECADGDVLNLDVTVTGGASTPVIDVYGIIYYTPAD